MSTIEDQLRKLGDEAERQLHAPAPNQRRPRPFMLVAAATLLVALTVGATLLATRTSNEPTTQVAATGTSQDDGDPVSFLPDNGWQALRECASGDNYNFEGSDGRAGAYGLDQQSWNAAVEHPGLRPYRARSIKDQPWIVQDFVAARVYETVGSGAWPNCGDLIGGPQLTPLTFAAVDTFGIPSDEGTLRIFIAPEVREPDWASLEAAALSWLADNSIDPETVDLQQSTPSEILDEFTVIFENEWPLAEYVTEADLPLTLTVTVPGGPVVLDASPLEAEANVLRAQWSHPDTPRILSIPRLGTEHVVRSGRHASTTDGYVATSWGFYASQSGVGAPLAGVETLQEGDTLSIRYAETALRPVPWSTDFEIVSITERPTDAVFAGHSVLREPTSATGPDGSPIFVSQQFGIRLITNHPHDPDLRIVIEALADVPDPASLALNSGD